MNGVYLLYQYLPGMSLDHLQPQVQTLSQLHQVHQGVVRGGVEGRERGIDAESGFL